MLDKLPFFKYNGVVSLDEQLIIQSKNTYAGAARDLSFTSVPGRSGDLLIDNKRYKNVTVKYTVAALEGIHDIPEIAHRVKGWLSSEIGYLELIDSYDPNYYRLAAYASAYDLEQELPCLGRSTIQFNCKPFRYSIEGKRPILLEASATIRNPEYFPAKPYIKITGSGNITLTINSKNYVFKNVDGYIEVDSEIMNAYKGSDPQNDKMYTPTFPELEKGDNAISWTGTVTSVEIVPRWCCL
jgi:phage-related protein